MSPLTGSAGILILMLVAVGLLAAILGLTIYLSQRQGRQRSQPTAKRRLPTQWPINPRPLLNSSERQVWHWLNATFPEHHTLVKLPITRFTKPRQQDESQQWFSVLSGAYCSFTLCDDHGRVIGCIDVMGPRGISRSNRQLKQTLLAQCGIGYWVISSESLPDSDQLRTDFLGAPALDSQPPQPNEQARLEAVRLQLHEALDRRRSDRHHALESSFHDGPDAGVTPWPQPDSFLGALDSQRSDLHPS